jgi:hypothetical protein
VYAHALFPERLSTHFQDLCRTLSEIRHHRIASGQIHDSRGT